MNMSGRMAEMYEFLGLAFDPQMQDCIAAMNGAPSDAAYFPVMRNPLSGIDKREREVDPETTEKVAEMIAHSGVGRFVLDRYAAVKEAMRAGGT